VCQHHFFSELILNSHFSSIPKYFLIWVVNSIHHSKGVAFVQLLFCRYSYKAFQTRRLNSSLPSSSNIGHSYLLLILQVGTGILITQELSQNNLIGTSILFTLYSSMVQEKSCSKILNCHQFKLIGTFIPSLSIIGLNCMYILRKNRRNNRSLFQGLYSCNKMKPVSLYFHLIKKFMFSNMV
jgi:hypothetical protein